jgi:hypothetical protein
MSVPSGQVSFSEVVTALELIKSAKRINGTFSAFEEPIAEGLVKNWQEKVDGYRKKLEEDSEKESKAAEAEAAEVAATPLAKDKDIKVVDVEEKGETEI